MITLRPVAWLLALVSFTGGGCSSTGSQTGVPEEEEFRASDMEWEVTPFDPPPRPIVMRDEERGPLSEAMRPLGSAVVATEHLDAYRQELEESLRNAPEDALWVDRYSAGRLQGTLFVTQDQFLFEQRGCLGVLAWAAGTVRSRTEEGITFELTGSSRASIFRGHKLLEASTFRGKPALLLPADMTIDRRRFVRP